MKKVLVIAPHPDDEILGVGGTIIKEVALGNEVFVCVVTKGVPPLFAEEFVEKTRSEARACHKRIGVKETVFLDFPSVMLEKEDRCVVNDSLGNVIQRLKPDDVYIPHIGDMQKDHQITAEAAMVCLRPKYNHKVSRIVAYETLSETDWNIPNVQNAFIPTVFSDISMYINQKLEALAMFESQLADYPNPRSIKAVEALAHHRGSTMSVNAAEAFVMIRELQ